MSLVSITVEVALALPQRQWLKRLQLPAGATVADAVHESGLLEEAGITGEALRTGIWSRPAAADAALANGDRVELYRPLQVDPKQARRLRARKDQSS